MIQGRSALHAVTLAEMMIALSGSIIVLGALLLSSTQLQRALYASERCAMKQADQRRLVDYLGRDLRRAIGLRTTTNVNGSGGTRLAASTVAVENGLSLAVVLPAYYQSQSTADDVYDEPLPVVVADNYVDYGTAAGHAPAVLVVFRKDYIDSEGCTCFVRLEGDSRTVIMRQADDMHLRVGLSEDGRVCDVEVAYTPATGLAPKVTTHEDVLMRNIRID